MASSSATSTRFRRVLDCECAITSTADRSLAFMYQLCRSLRVRKHRHSLAIVAIPERLLQSSQAHGVRTACNLLSATDGFDFRGTYELGQSRRGREILADRCRHEGCITCPLILRNEELPTVNCHSNDRINPKSIQLADFFFACNSSRHDQLPSGYLAKLPRYAKRESL